MSLSDPDAVHHAREELSKVSSLVLTARRLLAGGAMVNLGAIEERVRVVCQSIEAMPKPDGQALFSDVKELAVRLDSLEQDLKEHVERTRPSPDSPSAFGSESSATSLISPSVWGAKPGRA